jgi:hypothetical protein
MNVWRLFYRNLARQNKEQRLREFTHLSPPDANRKNAAKNAAGSKGVTDRRGQKTQILPLINADITDRKRFLDFFYQRHQR